MGPSSCMFQDSLLCPSQSGRWNLGSYSRFPSLRPSGSLLPIFWPKGKKKYCRGNGLFLAYFRSWGFCKAMVLLGDGVCGG